MSDKIAISVIMPVLDGEAFIAQALRSVLNQSRPPVEVIVVDNGSRDRSVEIAKSFGAPVRTIDAPQAGASAARNAGMAEARGDAVMFLDADDLLGPNVLEELATVLEYNPGAIACCPWMRFELADGCWLAAPASCAPKRRGQDDLAAWLTGWYHPPCSVLWSRAAYERSGGWDPEVRVNTDGDIMMRALIASVPLILTAGCTSYYRRLPGEAVSLSGRRLTRTGLESRLMVLDKIAGLLDVSGKLSRYKSPLAEAYDILAEGSSGTFPDLYERAVAASRSHGGSGGVRRVRRRLERTIPMGGIGQGARPAQTTTHSAPAPDRAMPSPDRPLVSVVVPTLNRSALLKRAIASVVVQTYSNLELLIIDDGSTEDITSIVPSFDDDRIRYFSQPENMGVAAARNRGIREAAGSLIAFLDSDDEWMPDKLLRQVELMRRRPDRVGLVFTGLTRVEANGDRLVEIPQSRGVVWQEMLHRNVVHYGTSSTMVRRDVVETVGFFDERLPCNEDYDYWTRIARFYELDIVPEPLIVYHNEVSSDDDSIERRSHNFAANMQAREMYFQRYGEEATREHVRHLYFMDTARRHLESPVGSSRAGRWLLAKALYSKPFEPRIYAWLLFSILPEKPRRALAPALKRWRTRVPARLWFGTKSTG